MAPPRPPALLTDSTIAALVDAANRTRILLFDTYINTTSQPLPLLTPFTDEACATKRFPVRTASH